MLKIKNAIIFFLVFLFPFLFLNIAQEYFATSKLYFLSFGIILLFLISIIQFIFSKKIHWYKSPLNLPIIIFTISILISTLLTPNKVQSIFNLNFGLLMIFSLTVLYFYFSQENRIKQLHKIVFISSVFLSTITIVFYFNPLKNISLPQNYVFLKNPGFTPMGSQLDLVILFGFFVIYSLTILLQKNQSLHDAIAINRLKITFFFSLLTLGLITYSILSGKPGYDILKQLPSFRLSWLTIPEIIKNPITALFGVGPDNFSTVFTKVKDLSYNQSLIWQNNSPQVSRSTLFQIVTEAGILGLLSFGYLIFTALYQQIIKSAKDKANYILVTIYLLVCLLVFPSSITIWFLFFISLALINQPNKITFDLADSLFVYLLITIFSFGLIGGASYLLGRSYVAEYVYKKSLDGIIKNNIKQTYDNQRQAVILNPFIEKYRNSFSQLNIFIANNLASKEPEKISKEDQEIITQAVQMAISEAKQLVKLNPNKAQYWVNLGNIYVDIVPFAKDSDVWAIASYQRAIAADPFNPIYQLNLAEIYYRIEKYKESIPFFEEAVRLKPDWSNAQYNLSWAYFKNKDYQKAVYSIQNSIKLIDKNIYPDEWEKVNHDFIFFKDEFEKSNENKLN